MQKLKSGRQTAAIIVLLVLLLILMSWLTGCMTAKNLPKHNDKFPLAAANYAAKKFPYKDSVGEVLFDTSSVQNIDHSILIDSLQKAIDSLNDHWASDIDGATGQVAESLLQKIDQGKKEIAGLKQIITKLREQYQPCAPDTVYKERTVFKKEGPELKAAQLNYQSEKTSREKSDAERKDWASKAKIRFWIIVSLILLIVAFAAAKIAKLFNRIPLPNNP